MSSLVKLQSFKVMYKGLHRCMLHCAQLYVMICSLLLFSEMRKEKGRFPI